MERTVCLSVYMPTCVHNFYQGVLLLVPIRINPSAVLDFLWACLHNPGLWQGRVRKEAVINSLLSLVTWVISIYHCHL